MSEIVGSITVVDEVFVKEDIVDGRKILFECESCAAPLMEIWETEPSAIPFWQVKAKCPHCGDGSEVKPVYSFRYHFSYIDKGDGKIYSVPSDHEDVQIRGKEITIWNCVKKDDWRPRGK